MGVAAALAVAAFGATPAQIGCAALAGAAFAAAIRMLTNDSPAALTGAGLAALLAIGLVIEQSHPSATTWLALAAAGWTIAELARTTRASSAVPVVATGQASSATKSARAIPSESPAQLSFSMKSTRTDASRATRKLLLPSTSPIVALLPAIVAALLEPACASLLVLAGIRMMTAPWQRPRWILAVPIAGAVVVLVAIVAGLARSGMFAGLATSWYGEPAHPIAPAALATAVAAALGPLVAVAALAGLALVVRVLHRGALAELAILACTAGALLADLRAGSVGPMSLGLAALAAGLAVGRLAAMIRIPSGQAVVGATCGVLLLVAPAYTALLAHSR